MTSRDLRPRAWNSSLPVRSSGLARAPWARPVVPLSANRARTREAGRKGAATRGGRADGFPRAVAALIDARDLWCAYCGSPFSLEHHHRRLKGSGGDPRPHTQCACNGVLLCHACHMWAHSGSGRREAEARGLIIPRAETAPWRHPLMVRTDAGSGSGFTAYPTCAGGWALEAPAGAA